MKAKILYGLATLFISAWAIGFFFFGVGLIIHILLVAAVMSVITKLIMEK